MEGTVHPLTGQAPGLTTGLETNLAQMSLDPNVAVTRCSLHVLCAQLPAPRVQRCPRHSQIRRLSPHSHEGGFLPRDSTDKMKAPVSRGPLVPRHLSDIGTRSAQGGRQTLPLGLQKFQEDVSIERTKSDTVGQERRTGFLAQALRTETYA